MTNAADNFHPALTTACKECSARVHEPCVFETPTESRWVGDRLTFLPKGMVAYRSAGEHNAIGRCPEGTGPAWGMVHTSRLSKAKGGEAKRLVASEKAGKRMLAQADDAVPTAKSARCYMAVRYLSEGGETLAFACGPMTPAAAQRVRDDANVDGVGIGVWAEWLSAEDVATATRTGKLGCARFVVLPSQHGAAGVERMADDSEDAVVEIAARRPAGRVVQADWLDAIAV
jgi:hypothetical protein